jgi:hypothetical protein
VTDENRHDGSNRHRRMPREGFDPTDVELLPRDECGPCSLEVGFAAPNSDNRLIDALARGFGSDDSNRAVRERQVLGVKQETVDGFSRRASSQEH